jgi:hypothetical protein
MPSFLHRHNYVFLNSSTYSFSIRTSHSLRLILLVATLTLLAPAMFAQSATATLSGVISDQNGDVVPGVNISVINLAQGFQRTTTSNDQGIFVIPLLPPGTYVAKAEREGFTTAEVRDLVLNVSDQISIKIQLKVGGVKGQTVDIIDAPALIDESPAVSTTVDRSFVENIPMNGRSFQALIALTPGIVLTKSTVTEQGQFSVNGQRADANYFMIDGASANIGVSTSSSLSQYGPGSLPGVSAAGGFNNLVSIDALQEFTIQASTYAPEFGRSPGAQISIITRSGTNDFRGSMFDYFRNDVLDATDWFTNRSGQRKPPLRQNDFGFVVGGPIILPRFGIGGHQPWYNGRNRTFFFLSYEGLRLRQPLTQLTEVPTVAARQSAPPQIRTFLNGFPLPNGRDLGSGKAEFAGSYSDPSNLDATSIRIDHNVSSKLTLFGRYNHAPSYLQQRGLSGFPLNSINITDFLTQTLTLGSTITITPTVFDELRVNYSKNVANNFLTADNFGGATPLVDSQLLPSFTTTRDSLFFFNLSGLTGGLLGIGKNAKNTQRQFNLVNSVSAITGNHQLKFGIDYRRVLPIFDQLKYQLAFSFAGVPGALTGIADSVSVTADIGPRFPIFNNTSLYGQDTWKVTPRLTLTYGLRWELNPPPTEANGKIPFAITGIDNLAAIALAPRGTPLYQTTHNNFAPRVGVAYQLSQRPGRETVLRGGVGVFYDLGYGLVANAFGRFPYTSSKNLIGIPVPITPAQAEPPPFADQLNPAPPYGNFTAVDPHLKLPRTYQWNLAAEQSLGKNQTLSASYIGAAGRRLLRSEIILPSAGLNPALFGPASRISLNRNATTSDYHALQVQFQRRLSRGLQALASYTWAHSIDTASADSGLGAPLSKINPEQDRGPSDFDVRHSFNAAISYNLPFSRTNRTLKALSRGWFVDSIFTARSATPVDVVVSRNLGFGSFSFRPDLLQGVPLYLNDSLVAGGRRINRSAFSIPIGRQGNLGRNSLRGFSVAQVDFALRRQFNLSERVNLQFKGEVFNIFNHPNFGDPVGLLGTASTAGVLTANSFFGQSTQMLGRSLGAGGITGGFNPLYQIGGPRSIQLALKLQF